MQSKGDIWSGETSHSTFLICAELCTDGLRLYAKQAPDEGRFSLPIVVVCVVLEDVTQIAAYMATSEGPYGLGEGVQIQNIVAIGVYICTALWHNLILAQPLSSPREQILSIRGLRHSARGWGLRVSTRSLPGITRSCSYAYARKVFKPSLAPQPLYVAAPNRFASRACLQVLD